jgi:hypothetical protein
MHRTPCRVRESAGPGALRPSLIQIPLTLLLVSSVAPFQDPAVRMEVSTRYPRAFVRHDDATLGRGLNVRELRRRSRRAAVTKGPETNALALDCLW